MISLSICRIQTNYAPCWCRVWRVIFVVSCRNNPMSRPTTTELRMHYLSCQNTNDDTKIKLSTTRLMLDVQVLQSTLENHRRHCKTLEILHCCVHVTETHKVHILSWCRSWKVYDNTELISWNRWSTHPRSVETTRERWSRDNLRIGISVAIVRLLTLLFLPTLMCMTWRVYVLESCSQRRLYLQSPVDPKLGRRIVN